MNDYFRPLNITSALTDKLLAKINSTPEQAWGTSLEQNLIKLKLDDLVEDKEIVQVINDIGNTDRLAIYRFFGEECYGWHIDAIRFSSINMLISGFDSMCIFGSMAPARRFVNIKRLMHEPKTYYVMDVKKMHTVFNFGKEIRYILSLGFPDIKYHDACSYLERNNMLSNK